ncbi:SAM-dependent methyltransferase [Candidatus Micrarchaeota archaeon]|nr:SAM-dependent methyltransferase [Candidatus Micrarchaeota archaeon]
MTSKKQLCTSRDGSITYTTDDNFIYAEKEGVTLRLDLFDRHYYKLRPYRGVPILEIDGLRMQLVKDFRTPLDYAKEVSRQLKIGSKKDAVVLDTCMGLGYTAIEASKKRGAKLVMAVEISDAVFTLAKWNPFSEPLWDKTGNILPVRGDISDLIKDFDSELFSYVIHDPPRFSHAPELYSLEFYKELYRVCKNGANIFHYTGSVGRKKGRKIHQEIEKRLRSAGFRKIRYAPRLQGLLFNK